MKKVMQMKFMKRCIEKQNAKHGVTQTEEENKDKKDGKKIRDQDVHWRSEPLGQGESSSSEDEKDSEEEQFNLNRFTEIAGNCRRTFGGEDKQEKEKKVEQNDKGKSMVKMHNRFVARNNEDFDGDDIKRKRIKDHSKPGNEREGHSGWKRFKRNE